MLSLWYLSESLKHTPRYVRLVCFFCSTVANPKRGQKGELPKNLFWYWKRFADYFFRGVLLVFSKNVCFSKVKHRSCVCTMYNVHYAIWVVHHIICVMYIYKLKTAYINTRHIVPQDRVYYLIINIIFLIFYFWIVFILFFLYSRISKGICFAKFLVIGYLLFTL